MAHSAARAMLIVDYVGLNGVFAVSSSPTMKKAFVQEFVALCHLLTNGGGEHNVGPVKAE